MQFRKHLLYYTLVPLIILCVGASYVRFFVLHDYLIAYEGQCNPSTNDCFTGCNDESCVDIYFYTKVQKYAPDLMQQCGVDIRDCEFANVCLSQNDRHCSITYCDRTDTNEGCDNIENTSIEVSKESL